MLVPVSAFMHASGGLVIYLMVFGLTQKKLAAFMTALPSLMLLSSTSWYAQLHKDGIFALGMLLKQTFGILLHRDLEYCYCLSN